MRLIWGGVILSGLCAGPVWADCAVSDFSIDGLKVETSQVGRPMVMTGKLSNHCSTPAAAQIKITAVDASGAEVQSRTGWPAGTANIAAGDAAIFNMGRMFRYSSDMASYHAEVVAVRVW